MSGTAYSGGSADRPTLESLAHYYTPKVVRNEALCVAVLALNMFLIWDDPGGPWGVVVTVVLSSYVVGRIWLLPRQHLLPYPHDAAIDPEGAAQTLQNVGDPALKQLVVPTFIGFAATLLSQGWMPVFLGALISLGGYTFLGPFRSQLGRWRDRLEQQGAKTGL